MKRIAYLNFHPAFSPPRSGGELRYLNLATRLADTFDVRLFNPTFGEAERETVEHAPHCIEERFPKTRAYHAWHRFFDRTARFAECSGLVSMLAVRRHRAYVEAVRAAAAQSDIVIHASPFVAPALPKGRPGQLFIYDSYNVEARLAEEGFGDGFWGRRASRHVARVEGSLARRADLVLVCSPEDGDEMAERYGIGHEKIVSVPNGVDANALRPPTDDERAAAATRLGLDPNRPACLFLGSFHPPNIEAARFIYFMAASVAPDADYLIAGKVCEALADKPLPSNVKLLGLVDEQTKADLLAACTLALNPMFSGSGTNLKMLEFLAAGMPIVTTPIGARGLSLEDGRHAMIVPGDRFAACVNDVLRDTKRQETLRREARGHAEATFHWEGIAERLRDLLLHRTSRRLLVVNDFPATPVTSGGKVRLHAVARHLSEHVAPVTLLTLAKEPRGRHAMHSPRWEEVNVVRPRFQNRLDQWLHLQLGVGTDDVTSTVCHRLHKSFRRELQRHAPDATAVVLSHCYLAPHARRFARRLPLVYESYNVETDLKRALLSGSVVGRWLVARTRRAERWALRSTRFTSCVSQADRERFAELEPTCGERLLLAENGVDCSRYDPVPHDKRTLLRRAIGLGTETTFLFVGSGHPPNRDGARFLLEVGAPALPEARFVLVGSVCGWFHGLVPPPNVVLAGEVSESVRDYLLACCDAGLNPLFEGGGSSLKVPEYMAAGLGVVSSRIGARGFAVGENGGLLLAEREEFAATLRALCADRAQLEALATAARERAVREFDWSVRLKDLGERLAALGE